MQIKTLDDYILINTDVYHFKKVLEVIIRNAIRKEPWLDRIFCSKAKKILKELLNSKEKNIFYNIYEAEKVNEGGISVNILKENSSSFKIKFSSFPKFNFRKRSQKEILIKKELEQL